MNFYEYKISLTIDHLQLLSGFVDFKHDLRTAWPGNSLVYCILLCYQKGTTENRNTLFSESKSSESSRKRKIIYTATIGCDESGKLMLPSLTRRKEKEKIKRSTERLVYNCCTLTEDFQL